MGHNRDRAPPLPWESRRRRWRPRPPLPACRAQRRALAPRVPATRWVKDHPAPARPTRGLRLLCGRSLPRCSRRRASRPPAGWSEATGRRGHGGGGDRLAPGGNRLAFRPLTSCPRGRRSSRPASRPPPHLTPVSAFACNIAPTSSAVRKAGRWTSSSRRSKKSFGGRHVASLRPSARRAWFARSSRPVTDATPCGTTWWPLIGPPWPYPRRSAA